MLTFEALQILDAIEKKGSFSAAADYLDRAPSSLSYQVQKLEQELDVVVFDRSGYKAVFTDAGQLLLNRGRALLNAADELVADTKSLANGWECELTIAIEGLFSARSLFPLLDRLSKESGTKLSLRSEMFTVGWNALKEDKADILLAPNLPTAGNEFKIQTIGNTENIWVAAYNHPIHQSLTPFEPFVRTLYRVVNVADTARHGKIQAIDNILPGQPRWQVSSMMEKYQAILDGYAIGTLPDWWIKADLANKKLKVINGSDKIKMHWVMAWKRNRMGNAKSWIIRHLPNALNMLANQDNK